jgi:hypothetical protein
MMKKVLVLLAICVLVSAANAVLTIGLYETDGVTEFDGRALAPSDSLIIKIESVGGDTGVYPGFALIADSSLGLITGGAVVMPPAPDGTVFLGTAEEAGVMGLGALDVGIAGAVDSFSTNAPFADGVYFDEILFHCQGEGDVTVYLYDIGTTWDIADGVIDSVVISQVPEPMTIALLGLGGLLLRRRK